MSRLLVISCSGRKHKKPAPAIELYDGPSYRILRSRAPRSLAILILSAEHGLIPTNKPLEPYDRKMDEDRAEEFQTEKQIERARRLVRKVDGYPFTEVFCHGGGHYRDVVRRYAHEGVFGSAKLRYTSGRIGEQLAQLKKFLLEGRPQVRRGNFWGLR